ncbi:signal transduction histidine kinase [Catenibacillus scindens]|uniref:histidine kinase n=1 Tax=Catenibacillus scindens TaxID=673271 RepID=A0A7W8M5S1_9FIRM|nr:HAMP domain-containing sensor histidine kinase [Catenibacillus scindens]MBB5265224.1 signal transduction histidine kinase [Catenibacillus scindens]
MKSTFRLIRRFVKILLLSLIGLFILNVALLIFVFTQAEPNFGGWTRANELGDALIKNSDGTFTLSENGTKILEETSAWAILVEDKTGDVIWHSDNLPGEVPLHYSVAQISYCTRGYIEDYPTTTASYGDDLIFMGYPKDVYWKHMWPAFDYQLIANAPKLVLLFLAVNCLAILFIYFASTSGVLKSVKPIVAAIEDLPAGKEIYVKEKGLWSDLAAALNRSCEKLMRQDRELKKKERARANWISGVSHDIRTPLSMVMGYASQLEESMSLSEKDRHKAAIICQQSLKIKNLINDLNLSSKLEYNMQPLCLETVNLVGIARQCAVDFMNTDLDGKYPLTWEMDEDMPPCIIRGDKNLLSRALNNLLNNVQSHNPDGCAIAVKVRKDQDICSICVADNGVGISDAQMERLQNTPHYMMSDDGTEEPRHGLGLLIVRQIVLAHHGILSFRPGNEGGFLVEMKFHCDSLKEK